MLTYHQWSPSDIHIRANSQDMPQPSITKIHLKITWSKISFKFPRGQWVNPFWHSDARCDIVMLILVSISSGNDWQHQAITWTSVHLQSVKFYGFDKRKVLRKCLGYHCPACRTTLVATRFRVAVIVRRAGLLWSQQDFEWRWSVPLFKCLTVLEFSFILFDLCLLITFFNFIMNYVPIVTFWIFTYHKIWILSIMFCSIWSYWIIYFLACLEVSWRVVS